MSDRAWYSISNAAASPQIADVHITDQIGGWGDGIFGDVVTAKGFVDDLGKLPASVRTIRLHINSPGGDVFAAVNMANALRDQRQSKGRTVDVMVEGLAASSASIVMMAGNSISVSDNSLVMIHNPWAAAVGDAKDMRTTADKLDKVRQTILATYKWQSSLSEDKLSAMMDATTWMDADEAIAAGFATKKVKGLKAAASYDPSALNKLAIPPRYADRLTAGVSAALRPHPAGVTALPSRTDDMAPNISDRIGELQKSRKATSERMSALYQPVLENTGSLDADQRTEYNNLKTTLSETDLQINDLLALEQSSVMPTGKPVGQPQNSLDGSEARHTGATQIVMGKMNRPPENEFVRLVICKTAAKILGVSPMEIAKSRYPDERRIHQVLNTAVAGGTTTDSTWANPLLTTPQLVASAFLEYLRPMTIIGQFGTGIIPPLRRVPFNMRAQTQTSGGSAGWVGQGKGKPVTKFNYDNVTLGFAKVAGISVISDELVRFSTPSSEDLIKAALADTVRERIDIDFIDPAKSASANVSPASITNGISATSHSGTDAAAVRTDIGSLLGKFITAKIRLRNLVWIMPESLAVELSLMRTAVGAMEFPDISAEGGKLAGYPVITSQYANVTGSPVENVVILVSANDIFLADDGGVSVEATNQASIEMSDDPENESGTVVSMFQTNQVALRAERYINWVRARTAAVAWLDTVLWAA